MLFSPSHDKILPAFLAAKAELAVLPLVKDRQGDKAKYLQLSTLLAALEPVLFTNGMFLTQGCAPDVFTDGVLVAMRITTRCVHALSGQWIENQVMIPVVGAQKAKTDGGGFNQPSQQSGGVTITYGRRYGIFAMFSLAVDEDSDGAEVQQTRRARATRVVAGIQAATENTTEELRKRLETNRLNDQKVICACGAKSGEPHKEGCKNAEASLR